MMKICLINNLYKPYNRGGAERVVELIAGGLWEAGHEVFLITTLPISRKHKNTKTQKHKNTKIYYISALYYNLNFLPKVLRLFWHIGDMFDVGSYFKVKSILKKEKPDVVMTHNLKGVGYLIPKVIKRLGLKHIHTLHDIQLLHPSGLMLYGKEKQIDSVLAKMYAGVCRWLFGSPDTVISPSKWLMKMHTDRGFFKDAKQVIIFNPVHKTEIQIVKDQYDNKIFNFLYVGQIEKHKGILFLIKVFQMLCEELDGVNCELVIIGDGSKMKQAKKLSSNNKNIRLLGKQSKKEVKNLMQKADCLVVPSLCYENSPTVIYEALSIGLPVIASRIGGITELIYNTGGILFRPGNGGDLMYQMKWAMEHGRELRKISENGKEKVKQFGLDNYINTMLRLNRYLKNLQNNELFDSK